MDPDLAFQLKNTNNKKVSADTRFWTSYNYERPAPRAIERICNTYGIQLQISGTQKPSHCLRVHRLLEYYLAWGEHKFEKCIKLLAQCFRANGSRKRVQDDALQSAFLRGFLDYAGTSLPRDFRKIKRALADSRLNSADIISKAIEIKDSSGARHSAVGIVLRRICNV